MVQVITDSLIRPVGLAKRPGMKDFVYFVKKTKQQQQKSAVKDKKHVLVHCPWYGSLRKELYNIIDDLCPDFKELRNNDKFNIF